MPKPKRPATTRTYAPPPSEPETIFAGLVAFARRQDPIPSRTRPSNVSAPMVLCLKTRESRSPPGPQRSPEFTPSDQQTARRPRATSARGRLAFRRGAQGSRTGPFRRETPTSVTRPHPGRPERAGSPSHQRQRRHRTRRRGVPSLVIGPSWPVLQMAGCGGRRSRPPRGNGLTRREGSLPMTVACASVPAGPASALPRFGRDARALVCGSEAA